MGDISKNFNRREFACPCGCEFDTVDVELITIWQDVREHFDKFQTLKAQANTSTEISDIEAITW